MPVAPRSAAHAIVAAALAAGISICAHAVPPSLARFSAELDGRWNFGNPTESETQFRQELARWPATDPQALIVATQIARTQGLRREFIAAHATLDAVEPQLAGAPSHVRVRFLLERGRVLNSAGAADRAVPLFAEALSLAECDGDEFDAIDAAHMLGIAAPPPERLKWNRKALAMAELAADPRAQRWRAALYTNIGQTYLEQGDAATALRYFDKALPAWAARRDDGAVRVAHWMIARAKRSLGRLDEAEAVQRTLAAEYAQIGQTDGYVFEELAEIALARGDTNAARSWAARAYAALEHDDQLKTSEPGRVLRLEALAQGRTPPTVKP